MSDQKIELIQYVEIIAKRRRFILGITIMAFVLAVVVSLLLPKSYQATALVLPPANGGGALNSLLGQFGGGNSLADLIPSQGNGPELYVRLLGTEIVKNEIIDRFNLLQEEDGATREGLYKLLDRKTTIEADRRAGIISISVEDRDPEQAAAMANVYTTSLGELVARLSSDSAGMERIFLEKRLKEEKAALAQAEEALKVFQSQNKALDVGEQGKASIEGVARLRAELAEQEVRLATYRQSMTEANPEVLTIRSTIEQLRHQVDDLEGGGNGESSAIPSVGAVPDLGQQYGRLLRNLKIRENVVELLTRQYEIANLGELKDVSGVKVVQKAQVPEQKFKPRRTRIVLLTTYAALFCSVFGAFILERLALLPAEKRERWRRLRIQLLKR
jgi:uncharacterized protein involved in exopolysaccharide biosynthesis